MLIDLIKRALGKVGSTIEYIGPKIPTPIKHLMGGVVTGLTFGAIPSDIFAKERRFSERFQEIGAEPLVKKDPVAAEKKAQEKAGFPSARGRLWERQRQLEMAPKNISVDPNAVSTLRHERAMGANVGDIREFGGENWRWTGEKWEREQAPSSPPSREEVLSDIENVVSKYNLGGVVKEGDVDKILRDIYERGMGRAEAIEKGLREVAEREWEAKKSILERQRGEIGTEAERQRQKAREEETFYTGELEKKKQKELRDIELQKQGQERTYLQMRDDLGERFADTQRDLEAKFRAYGLSASSFAFGEERKILRDFNRNLTTMALKHKDALEELDRAHRDTVELYDSKIAELQKDVRNKISDIDAWEREQIGKIQDNEMLSLAQKFEKIAEAINRAEQIRLQVEQNFAQQKLAWQQWLSSIQLKVAQVANEAARDRMATANKYLDDINKAYQSTAIGLGKWMPAEGGGWTLYTPSPYTKTGWVPINTVPYTEEEKERIEDKYMKPSEPEWMKVADLISQSSSTGPPSW